MIRTVAAIALVLGLLVGPAMAQWPGIDQEHKPASEGLTPGRGDSEGVLVFENNTPADTIKTWPIFVRGARRIWWRITGSDTVTAAPCSLAAAYVSNANAPDTSFIARNATTVGWTVNDYVSNLRLGSISGGAAIPRSGSGGGTVEVLCGGGANRSAWDFVLLVLTKKGGLAGRMDSLRVTAWIQRD